MNEGVQLRWTCPWPLLLGVLAGLLSSGCSGLRVHRPQDLTNAQAAQTQFQAADLAQTVAAERQRLDKVLADELELIRKHTLARRDARLVYIIGEGDSTAAWDFLEKDIKERIGELGLDETTFAATLAKLAQLPNAKRALGQSSAEWKAFQAGNPNLPTLSCPLQEGFDETSFSKDADEADAFEDYKLNCASFLAINTIPSKNGEEIKKLRRAKADAEKATEGALEALAQARTDYAQSLAGTDPDKQAQRRLKLLATFEDLGKLGDQLQGISDGKATLEAMGLKGAVAGLQATVEKAKLQVEQGDVIAALSTTLDNEDAQKWLFPRLQSQSATKVVSALVDIGTTLKATEGSRPVTALLVRQGQLDLDIQEAEKKEAFFDRVVELLEAQDQAAQDEVVYLGQAMRWLTDLRNGGCLTAEGTATGGIAQLLATGTQEKCREKVFRLLVAYSSSWTFGRVPQDQVDQQIIGLHQQAALDASEIAFAKWQSLFDLPIGQLVALYKTGIRPQDILDFLNVLGLGAIAAGVN